MSLHSIFSSFYRLNLFHSDQSFYFPKSLILSSFFPLFFASVYVCAQSTLGPSHFFLLSNEIGSPTDGSVKTQHLAGAWHIEDTQHLLRILVNLQIEHTIHQRSLESSRTGEAERERMRESPWLRHPLMSTLVGDQMAGSGASSRRQHQVSTSWWQKEQKGSQDCSQRDVMSGSTQARNQLSSAMEQELLITTTRSTPSKQTNSMPGQKRRLERWRKKPPDGEDWSPAWGGTAD